MSEKQVLEFWSPWTLSGQAFADLPVINKSGKIFAEAESLE
jgi:hypothetical protein